MWFLGHTVGFFSVDYHLFASHHRNIPTTSQPFLISTSPMNFQLLLLLFLFSTVQSQPRIPLSKEPSFVITCSPRCGGCQLEDGQRIDCPFLPKGQFSILRGEYLPKFKTFSIVYVSRVGCFARGFARGTRFGGYKCPSIPGKRTKLGSLTCTFANSQTQPPNITETTTAITDAPNSTNPTLTVQPEYPEVTDVPHLEPTSDDNHGSEEGPISTVLPSTDLTGSTPPVYNTALTPLPSTSPPLLSTEIPEPTMVETEVTTVPRTERRISPAGSEGKNASNELQARLSRLSIKGTGGCRNSITMQTSERHHIYNCYPGAY